MKAQWQLIDLETGKALAILGEPFDFDREEFRISWIEQFKHPAEIKHPILIESDATQT